MPNTVKVAITAVVPVIGLGPHRHRALYPRDTRRIHHYKLSPNALPRVQLRRIWRALPQQTGGLFGHAQNNGAAKVLALAKYDSQKLPGMPPRANLNSIAMSSTLDGRAE